MKVLHLSSWYPNKKQEKEALFIKRQLEALAGIANAQRIVHLQIKPGRLGYEKYLSEKVEHRILTVPFNRWFVIEIVSFIALTYCLIKHKANSFDIINVHIAYPNLTYWHLIKRWIRPQLVITEHWSAYHFNFNLPKPPPRIQYIFRQNIPVISVSRALLKDIQTFSGATFPCAIVPNVVDDKVFYRRKEVRRESGRFFMVSNWKDPKNPFLVIRSFCNLWKQDKSLKLVIGGYGPLWDDMIGLVAELNMDNAIEWLGSMDSPQIALEMNRASAYLHCSGYETFSVVCAEALACGCYLIASRVGGIPELIEPGTGLLVKAPNVEAWTEAMVEGVSPKELPGINRFYPEAIGNRYYEALRSFLEGGMKNKQYT